VEKVSKAVHKNTYLAGSLVNESDETEL